jgi:hypothetical protein
MLCAKELKADCGIVGLLRNDPSGKNDIAYQDELTLRTDPLEEKNSEAN